jgi:hypothetical protein
VLVLVLVATHPGCASAVTPSLFNAALHCTRHVYIDISSCMFGGVARLIQWYAESNSGTKSNTSGRDLRVFRKEGVALDKWLLVLTVCR